tara:strand:- start:10907 stop:11842 length:936 start_codon:yes stop_codon:yes gene_type:complete
LGKKLNSSVFIIHFIFWIYELTLVLMFSNDYRSAIWNYTLFVPVVYLHYFILVPKIIKDPSPKYFLKWLFVFFLITFIRKQVDSYIATNYFNVWGWMEWEEKYDFYERLKASFLHSISNISGILALSLGSKYFDNKKKSDELQRMKIKNELNSIKNQIDIPESINILSKLEQISKTNPKGIQEQIIQLSSVLRYHLYSNQREVILSKELEVVVNQLRLYNKLNNSELKLFNRVTDCNVKTGVLSKAIGEVLKHTKKVKSKLELVEFSGNTCLKVSDSNPDTLKEINERVRKKFSNQLRIQTISQSILIQLN